jgi:hypothetical protein
MMGDRYRFAHGFLPETELLLIEAGSFQLPADMVWANIGRAGEGGPAFRIATYASNLEPVEPPLPPEPPLGSVVLDRDGDAWQRGLTRRGNWCCTRNDGAEDRWEDLWDGYGPLVRLVPDPAAGVELPWHAPVNEVSVGAENVVDVNDDGEVAERVRLVMGGYHQTLFTPDGAREKAAALLAAADAAEKEVAP